MRCFIRLDSFAIRLRHGRALLNMNSVKDHLQRLSLTNFGDAKFSLHHRYKKS